MTYQPTTWSDRVVDKPRTFNFQNNADGTTTLIPASGTVYTAGTPVNAANMNNIEEGIQDRATWDSVHSVEREVLNLKILSTLKTKVDGASDFFFDDITNKAATPDGSSMNIDMTQTSISAATSAGATTCVVQNTTGLVVGMEVTVQSITNGGQLERRIIKTIAGTTVTFTQGLTSAYPVGSLVYRSLVNRLTSGSMKFQKASAILGKPDYTASSLTYAAMGTDTGVFKSTDFSSFQNMGFDDTQLGAGGDIMVKADRNVSTLTIFNRVGDQYVSSQVINLSAAPAMIQYRLSEDSKWIFVTLNTGATGSPIAIYKLVNGVYVRLPDSNITGVTIGSTWIQPTSTTMNDMQISPSTTYFGVAYNNANGIYMLKRTGDTFALISQASAVPTTINRFSWSPDEKFLAWTSVWNPNSCGVVKRTNDTFASLVYPLPNLSNYGTFWPVFSPDGKWLVINNATGSSYRYVRFYSISGDTFTHYKVAGGAVNIFATYGFFTNDSKFFIMPSNISGSSAYWRITTTDTTDATAINFNPAYVNNAYFMKTDPSQTILYHSFLGFLSSTNKGSVDVTTADVRYETKVSKPITAAVAFIERSSAVAMTVTAALSVDTGTENPITMDADADETVDATTLSTTFSKELTAGTSATIRLTMNRANTTLDPAITKVMGATE